MSTSDNQKDQSKRHVKYVFSLGQKYFSLLRSKKILFWILVFGFVFILDLGYLTLRQQPPFKQTLDAATTLKLKPKKPTPSPTPFVPTPIPVATPTPPPRINLNTWHSYQDEQLGLAFKYPADWQILDASESARPKTIQVEVLSLSKDKVVNQIDHQYSSYARQGWITLGDIYAERFTQAKGKYNNEYVVVPLEATKTILVHATTATTDEEKGQQMYLLEKMFTTMSLTTSSNTEDTSP